MKAASIVCEPASDELDSLFSPNANDHKSFEYLASFSDDIEALNVVEVESKRAKTAAGVVVQHRSWQTGDIFRSNLDPLKIFPPPASSVMASSPPLTPSPQKKRKFAELDLGKSTLTRPVKAQRSYYGIDIHKLLEEAQAEESIPKAAYDLPTPPSEPVSKKSTLLWTEKYRARKFTDLIGDERTHRSVMHWLKRWDSIVFPGASRPKPKSKSTTEYNHEDKPHRKILMLTGPPGLGKTTLAHVCAKQAGYDVQEINASDERSSSVVKGRVRDMVGTENVKSVDAKAGGDRARKAAKPVCVIIDEVDGVVTGSGGGGEGGFIKALVDLVMLDQKNSTPLGSLQQAPARKKKGDRFRLLRPIILVCNDVYHPSLRPLRQSSIAEVIHVRKPAVQNLITRLQGIFEKEGVRCETDGVRRLCEATWGVSNRKEDKHGSGAGEGDMRGILVVGEWVAGKLRATVDSGQSLTRKWVEDNVLQDLAHGGGAARGLGRGGPKDIVERVFQEGAGFPKQTMNITPAHKIGDGITSVKGVAEGLRRTATDRLRELINTHGDTDRIMTDCFSAYPDRPFQDDTLLSKPDSAYEWLHFHDRLSNAVHTSNEWELAPYLSAPVLAFHHLFASPTRSQYVSANEPTEDSPETTNPFLGPSASWTAHELEKQNLSHLQSLQSTLSLPLTRLFSSTSDLATDLQPYLLRMLNPSINPILVTGGGSNGEKSTASVRKASEQALVRRAVNAMGASGVRFERVRVTTSSPDDPSSSYTGSNQWVYRMEPPLDSLGDFPTAPKGMMARDLSGCSNATNGGVGGHKTRYAVRQVLEQEWGKEAARLAEEARMARFGGGHGRKPTVSGAGGAAGRKIGDGDGGGDSAVDLRNSSKVKVARDFFGRPVQVVVPSDIGEGERDGKTKKKRATKEGEGDRRVWVTFHEGYSNAVRKPITLAEFMKDF